MKQHIWKCSPILPIQQDSWHRARTSSLNHNSLLIMSVVFHRSMTFTAHCNISFWSGTHQVNLQPKKQAPYFQWQMKTHLSGLLFLLSPDCFPSGIPPATPTYSSNRLLRSSDAVNNTWEFVLHWESQTSKQQKRSFKARLQSKAGIHMNT